MAYVSALFGIPRCICGHHMDAHHTTPSGRSTWCGVWDGIPAKPCDCLNYEPQPDEQDIIQ
jgi:hypothetical protein